MKINVITDDVNIDESPHVSGIFKPGDIVHFAVTCTDILEEAKSPSDRLLAEQFGRYPDPADDLRKDLFATRAAVASLRDSLADIERKLATMPIGGDPGSIRTWEHYRRRSRAELTLNKQKLDGIVTSLGVYGEQRTSE